jgi:hypothetical protein
MSVSLAIDVIRLGYSRSPRMLEAFLKLFAIN